MICLALAAWAWGCDSRPGPSKTIFEDSDQLSGAKYAAASVAAEIPKRADAIEKIVGPTDLLGFVRDHTQSLKESGVDLLTKVVPEFDRLAGQLQAQKDEIDRLKREKEEQERKRGEHLRDAYAWCAFVSGLVLALSIAGVAVAMFMGLGHNVIKLAIAGAITGFVCLVTFTVLSTKLTPIIIGGGALIAVGMTACVVVMWRKGKLHDPNDPFIIRKVMDIKREPNDPAKVVARCDEIATCWRATPSGELSWQLAQKQFEK